MVNGREGREGEKKLVGGERKGREGREEISWWVVKEREAREKYVAFCMNGKEWNARWKNIYQVEDGDLIYEEGERKRTGRRVQGEWIAWQEERVRGGGDSVEIFVNGTFSYLRQDIFIYLSVSGLLSPGVYLFLVFCQS